MNKLILLNIIGLFYSCVLSKDIPSNYYYNVYSGYGDDTVDSDLGTVHVYMHYFLLDTIIYNDIKHAIVIQNVIYYDILEKYHIFDCYDSYHDSLRTIKDNTISLKKRNNCFVDSLLSLKKIGSYLVITNKDLFQELIHYKIDDNCEIENYQKTRKRFFKRDGIIKEKYEFSGIPDCAFVSLLSKHVYIVRLEELLYLSETTGTP
jgi:hypothetical protein